MRFQIDLDEELGSELRELARRQRRTIRQQAVVLLEQAVRTAAKEANHDD